MDHYRRCTINENGDCSCWDAGRSGSPGLNRSGNFRCEAKAIRECESGCDDAVSDIDPDCSVHGYA